VVFFVPTPSSSELGWVWSRKSPTTSWLGLPWRRGRDCPKRAFPLRLQGKPYDRFALGVFFALFPRPSKLGSVRERKSPATSWLGLPWRRGRDCPTIEGEASRKALRSLRARGLFRSLPSPKQAWLGQGAKKPGHFVAGPSLAEREGFEPPVPLRAHLFSRQTRSTTLAPLRYGAPNIAERA
jgi:hypothetical protein